MRMLGYSDTVSWCYGASQLQFYKMPSAPSAQEERGPQLPWWSEAISMLKLKLICDRQTVGQFVWVSGLPMGPLTRFYLVLFSADNYLIILNKASSLTRRRVCSLQWNHSLVQITILYWLIWDCVPFLSPLTTRRDYGGGILTRLHTGNSHFNVYINLMYVWPITI
jgi:hypothetical protein